jgi:AsmA family protein
MKLIRLLAGLFGLLLVVPIVGVTIFLATFDANSYREPLAKMLTEQTGRSVVLNGPISFGFTDHFHFTIKDVVIGNVAWASRKEFAKIGELELAVALRPLLQKRLEITKIALMNADIQMEVNGEGKSNAEFQFGKSGAKKQPANGATKMIADTTEEVVKQVQSSVIRFDHVTVRQSRLASRGKDGKMTVLDVKSMTARPGTTSLALELHGVMNGTDLRTKIDGAAGDILVKGEPWPFAMTLRYGPYDMKGKGALTQKSKTLSLEQFALQAGGSDLTGTLKITYGGTRPSLSGDMKSQNFNPDDFKPTAGGQSGSGDEASSASQDPIKSAGAPLLSPDPINTDGLKIANAKLGLEIEKLEMKNLDINKVVTNVNLENGRLLLSPLSFQMGKQPVKGQLRIDASQQPMQLSVMLNANNVELQNMMKFWGAEALVIGKADLDIDLAGAGNSPRQIASTMTGTINTVVGAGDMPTAAWKGVASNVISSFLPGYGDLLSTRMNCFAARLKAQNGILISDGILLDTAQVTMLGTGEINLLTERVNFLFRPEPKETNLASLTPPVRISGPFTKPNIAPDMKGTAEKLAANFLGFRNEDSFVPMVTPTTNGNACLLALQNPQPSQRQKGALQDLATKAREKVQGVVGEQVQKLQEKASDILQKTVGGQLGKTLGNDAGQLLQGLTGGLLGKQPAAVPAAIPAPAPVEPAVAPAAPPVPSPEPQPILMPAAPAAPPSLPAAPAAPPSLEEQLLQQLLQPQGQ